jgi:hypothetical protein
MVVRSQSDMNEILRKCDVGALHEPLRHWAAHAVVHVITVHSQREEGVR